MSKTVASAVDFGRARAGTFLPPMFLPSPKAMAAPSESRRVKLPPLMSPEEWQTSLEEEHTRWHAEATELLNQLLGDIEQA
jgi:hypothetical protein